MGRPVILSIFLIVCGFFLFVVLHLSNLDPELAAVPDAEDVHGAPHEVAKQLRELGTLFLVVILAYT